MPSNIQTHIQQLQRFIEKYNFTGYDPYDALNSPLLNFLSSSSKNLRILFTQALKRIPFNIRPILGIQKGLNPKALGLFLWGYAKLYAVEKDEKYIQKIKGILDLLEQTRSGGYSGNCWGYNFDWQSRAFFLPKYTPTIVNSSFIGHALIDTYRLVNLEQALLMALSIKNFILNDLNRTQHGNDLCFSYTPIDHTSIHNANLLGSSLLIRLHSFEPDEEAKKISLSSFEYSLGYQNTDGSWYYAETNYQKWIDSFHTGFNLQSIRYFLEEGFEEHYRDKYLNGVEFYKNNFFLEDGTPKYFHNKTYPIDIHSPTQALVFFSKLGKDYQELTELLLKWFITNMKDKKGYFYFQKTPLHTNKIAYMRWAQAWAFHALTEYLLQASKT